MQWIKKSISCRTYCKNMEICVEGYELENGVTVQYLDGKWLDDEGKEYESIATIYGEIIGFMLRDDKREFLNSNYCSELANEILHAERRIHHAIDNYRPDMPEVLEKALVEAEKSLNILRGLLKEYRQ